MPKATKKLRGSTLVAHVFSELRHELGDEFSTEELLQAAESLISLSRDEYISQALETETEKSDYRNDNVCRSFERRLWEMLRQEIRDDSIEDDRLSTDFEAKVFMDHLMKRRGYA